MKKRTILFCSFILTSILMTGCGSGKTNEQHQPSTVPETNTPTAETKQITSKSQDDTTTMITPEEAKVIALQHADLVKEEVTFSKCELDEDFDGSNYDVEFYTEDRIEYDYEIDAFTGEILGHDWDGEDTLFADSMEEASSDATSNGDVANNFQDPTNTIISEEDARKIALEQVAGATDEHILEFDRDYDDGRVKFEIEIFFENKEYTFDIDAKDGTILGREVD